MKVTADPTFATTPGSELMAEELLVPMRDGVRLATDLYLPPPAARPRVGHMPTVLVRLPYEKRGDVSFMPPVAAYLAERGYAVVVQDVRGKGRSEGAIDPFVHEVADGTDTLDWISAQPWSNGAVGMIGDSYYGFTQWAAAVGGHPALRAIVPRVTSTRLADDWMHHGGVFCFGPMVDWVASTWMDADVHDFERDWSRRPLADVVPSWHAGRKAPVLDRWRVEGPDSPYWTRGHLASVSPATLRVPALHLGGFWDLFRRGQVRDWRTAAGQAPGQRLVLAATDHQWTQLPANPGPATNPMATAEAFAAFLPRYLDDAAAFLDQHLRGVPAPAGEPPVRYELSGAGWQSSASWPPPEARDMSLYPADAANAAAGPEGGSLAGRPDPGGTSVSWVHDPADLVPTNDLDVWCPLLELPDERDVEVRPDVLTFTADPWAVDLDLVGDQEVLLEVSTDAGPSAVVAKLVHVFPDGTARRITEGAARLVTHGDVAPPTVVRVDLGPTAYRIPAGHRLRLEVAASHFPRYLPALATGADPWSAEPGEPWQHRLHLGPDTRLLLQIL